MSNEEKRMSVATTLWMRQTQAEPKRTFHRSLVVVGALVVVLILTPALVHVIFYPAYVGADDAFIHVAVAEHILRGDGWGIISHDRVNLSSSPLFTILLLAVLPIGSIGLAEILSLVFASAALAITFFATRKITASTMCGLAALVVAAANAHLWRWSGTVMETALAYLAVTVIATATLRLMQARDSSVWNSALLGALIALGTLVRFEMGLLLPLSIVALWFSRHSGVRQIAAIVGGFVVVFLPWILFATAYFGTPIPTTFLAKANTIQLVNPLITKQIGTVVAVGFGVSILIAAIAIVIARRSVEGRTKLRGYAMPLLYLLAWPTTLFAYYYIDTLGLQGGARQFLPGMATWPIAVGLILSAVPRNPRYRPWLATGLVGCMAVGLVFNMVYVRPVLASYNDGYLRAMTRGAEYLRENCKPGDVALFYVDIGIMARDGIGHCTLADAGALATPSLHGMTLSEQLSRVKATYLVQNQGRSRNELAADYPNLKLAMFESYAAQAVTPDLPTLYLNIYRVRT
jgi:hypothetical protein